MIALERTNKSVATHCLEIYCMYRKQRPDRIALNSLFCLDLDSNPIAWLLSDSHSTSCTRDTTDGSLCGLVFMFMWFYTLTHLDTCRHFSFRLLDQNKRTRTTNTTKQPKLAEFPTCIISWFLMVYRLKRIKIMLNGFARSATTHR